MTAARYLAAVDERLKALLADGECEWGRLLGRMQGADPVLVAERLHALGSEVGSDGAGEGGEVIRWAPELHPLRAEWYFSAATASALARRFAGPRLLCLGAPTVAAASSGAVLVEREAEIVRARFGSALGAVLALDLSRVDALPVVGAHAAVVDPPWYAPHPERWLILAARAVGPGGHVAMVLPPRLQRPTAEAERDTVLQLAARCGETSLEPDAVVYDTPAFEQIAMDAAGIRVPPRWRRADLLVVEVGDGPSKVPPAEDGEPATFELFTIGARIVALSTRDRPGPPRAEPVPDTTDFVWDRITRRDPRIDAIDLWTSHNRVATVSGHAELRSALRALAAGVSLARAVTDPTLREHLATLLA